MRGWGTSRRALFEQLDKPALRSLPPLAYEYAEWKRCRVGLNYHVEIANTTTVCRISCSATRSLRFF
jgi:hypothetical protein